jgi:hypothetical protein
LWSEGLLGVGCGDGAGREDQEYLKHVISAHIKVFPRKKMVQIGQIFKGFFFSKSQNLYDKFQRVVKNIEGFCFLFATFLSNM